MEHWAAAESAFPNTCMDMDLKDDDVLFQGYWMETNDGCSHPGEPIFGSDHLSLNSPSYQEIYHQNEMEKSPQEPPLDCVGIEQHIVKIATSLVQPQSCPLEGAEFGSKWWVGSLERGFPKDQKSQPPGLTMEGEYACVSWDYPKQEPREEEFKITTAHWEMNDLDFNSQQVYPYSLQPPQRLLGNKKPGVKKQTKPQKTISLQVIRQHFARSLKDAAKCMGVCPTTLKRICRQYGITRWPSRKINKVSHSLKKLQLVVDSVEGAEGLIKINSIYSTFPELSSPDLSKDTLLSSHELNDNSKKPKSDSSSTSQTSGSSFSYSIETKRPSITTNGLNLDHTLDSEEANVNSFRESQTPKESSDHQCSNTPPAFKVKAAFGDSNIRFSLQPHWSLKHLQLEIAKRFRIDDFGGIHLKYLDNDFEPVLLTCDEDLEECKDLFRSSHVHTIKMSLHRFPQMGLNCSS